MNCVPPEKNSNFLKMAPVMELTVCPMMVYTVIVPFG